MARKITIFDTTLRDGEQVPGAALNSAEKMLIAEQLVKLNVDCLEAGNPISSPDDEAAVQAIAEKFGSIEGGPMIVALARCVLKDVEAVLRALAPASKQGMPHIYIGVSPDHMEGQLRKAPDEVLKMAVQCVQHAKSDFNQIEFSPMDAARAEWEFLQEVILATIEAGATTINIPDTVGYAVPEQFQNLIARIIQGIDAIRNKEVLLSVHCHNDLGMAVANSLQALMAGHALDLPMQIECAVNGMGERAGNAALEEIVMAIKTRGDYYGAWTQVNTSLIVPTSRLVSRLTRFLVPPNKAIVGSNAFAHSSGVHADGVIKRRTTYEIISPEEVGWVGNQIVLTPRSGRHALQNRIKELGFEMDNATLERVYNRFLELALAVKTVSDADLIALISDEIPTVPKTYTMLESDISYERRGGKQAWAEVKLTRDGVGYRQAAYGAGPVAAVCQAIDKITALADYKMAEFAIHATGPGAEAQGETVVVIQNNGDRFTGRGASTDIVIASARAYLSAINVMLYMSQKAAPI